MNTRNKGKQNKGAMTLEATIVLPFFLMLFLFMMYMVNVCNAYLALNNAVDQCTKHLDNVAYVTAKLDAGAADDMDDLEETIKEKVSGVFKGETSLEEFLNQVLKEIGLYAASRLEGELLQADSKELIVDMTKNSKVNTDNIEITLFKMPYQAVSGSNAEKYKNRFGDEDIVVQATYTIHMNLMLKQYDFKIVSTCVEKAWLNGSFNEHI